MKIRVKGVEIPDYLTDRDIHRGDIIDALPLPGTKDGTLCFTVLIGEDKEQCIITPENYIKL